MSTRYLVLIFLAVKLVLHLMTSQGYGYFRDELYYIACSEHLDFGYVDHPAFSIALLRCWRAVFGDSLLAIRCLPALAGALTMGLVGVMARDLGGGRFAQVLSMTAALVAPAYLSSSQYYSMNALDLRFWSVAAWILIRIALGGSHLLWPLLGLVLGLGLSNKISVLWLGAGLLVGLVFTRERRWLRTPWPWLAGGIAALGMAPYLFWQLSHHWATLEFIDNATGEKMAAVSFVDFLLGQVEMMHFINLPIWLLGLGFFFVSESGRPFRLLGWIYATVFLVLVGAGTSRSGYLAPAYAWLLPGGACWFESWLDRKHRGPALRAVVLSFWLLAGLALLPFTVPLLPVETYIRYAAALGREPSTEERKELSALGQHYADMHGWEEIVAKVGGVFQSLPPEERERAAILAPDYGVAAAIDFFGASYGLPKASSGHNNYWFWGPQGGEDLLIVVGGSETLLRRWFEAAELASESLDCGYCMPYEARRPVWVGRRMRGPLDDFWMAMRHYD